MLDEILWTYFKIYLEFISVKVVFINKVENAYFEKKKKRGKERGKYNTNSFQVVKS